MTTTSTLLPLKLRTLDQGQDELAEGEVLGLGLFDDGGGELFIGEAIGAAEGVFDQGFGEALGEVFAAVGDEVAEVEVGLEGGAVVERPAGSMGQSLLILES